MDKIHISDWSFNLTHYFELTYSLAKKDLKVRYKSATLGFLWALLNPLLMMVVLSVIFSFVFKVHTDSPYSVFVLCGLIPWTFFNLSLSGATSAIVDNASLIKKVYFPREIIPISVIMANLVNFCLSLVFLFIFLLLFKVKITVFILLCPLVVILQMIFISGISLFTSGLNVYYRDVKYIVEAVLLVLFYMSPVFYPVSMVPGRFREIYMLNPMAGIITFYRELILEGRIPDLSLIFVTIITCLVIFSVGFFTFKRCEPAFADLI